ncbi:PaaI family thioesterase [Fluviicola sp.]|uniref:PaaI family thioesterase n=1 Tax=Fluviicola sp. TaxID=1917219 RepID=UPI0031D3637E
MKRERTYSWGNPLEGVELSRELSGLEYLQGMMRGEIPASPLIHTLDFEIGEIEEGKVSFVFEPHEFHYNPNGSVHGGVITSILDSAMGCTLHSLLPKGVVYTTLELKVNFLKMVHSKTGKLTAVGKVIHLGGRTALVEASLTDESGRTYAHAVSTCMILKNE